MKENDLTHWDGSHEPRDLPGDDLGDEAGDFADSDDDAGRDPDTDAFGGADIDPDTDASDAAGFDTGTRASEKLPDDWTARAEELRDDFLCEREPDAFEEARLNEFLQLCLRFSYLEKRVQGEILCEIPAHLAILRGDDYGDLVEEAEALAEQERKNLGLEQGPIEDLQEIFDELGVKIIEMDPGSGGHSGAFVFTDKTGPALLSIAPPKTPVGRFILAHEYCHLLHPTCSRYM